MRRDAPVYFGMKQVILLLLTGWSLVRIRPGEPTPNPTLDIALFSPLIG
jgi:hypothetical protein